MLRTVRAPNQKGPGGKRHVEAGDRQHMRKPGLPQHLDRLTADCPLFRGHQRCRKRSRVAADRCTDALSDGLPHRGDAGRQG